MMWCCGNCVLFCHEMMIQSIMPCMVVELCNPDVWYWIRVQYSTLCTLYYTVPSHVFTMYCPVQSCFMEFLCTNFCTSFTPSHVLSVLHQFFFNSKNSNHNVSVSRMLIWCCDVVVIEWLLLMKWWYKHHAWYGDRFVEPGFSILVVSPTVPWVILVPSTVYSTNIVQYHLVLPVLDFCSSILLCSNIFSLFEF
jgi:hypothetical protein